MNNQITIYSTSWCGFCKAAKHYFDTIGATYSDINIENEPEVAKQIVKESGQIGVPVIRIGSKLIIGFDRPKIDEAIQSENITIKKGK